MLGHLLVEYDFHNHVASDVAIGQLFLPTGNKASQTNLNLIADWSVHNLKKINKSNTNYIVFTRARAPISTRLTLNDKVLERKSCMKLLGVWLQENGRWDKNIAETCKSAYQRVSMLTKLRYAGEITENLIHIYKEFIRSKLEYCLIV